MNCGFDGVDWSLYSDSQSAIHLAKYLVFHSLAKHIYLRYHFIQSLSEDRQFKFVTIEGMKNPADMLTISVHGQKFSFYSTLVQVC